MANPQKEDGYIAFANDLWDAIIKIRIPGEARQCFDFIARKTYGWNKKSDNIALKQFVDATGIVKPHVCRALIQLSTMNMIIITKKGNGITEYAIQKDFEKWKPLPKKVTLPKKVMPVTKKGNVENEQKNGLNQDAISDIELKNEIKSVTNNGTHKTIYKPTSTKPSIIAKKILLKLNQITKRNYSDTELVLNNLINGRTYEQHIQIIDVKQHDPYFIERPHLMNPDTLFGKNFDIYVNQRIEDFQKRQQKSNQYCDDFSDAQENYDEW